MVTARCSPRGENRQKKAPPCRAAPFSRTVFYRSCVLRTRMTKAIVAEIGARANIVGAEPLLAVGDVAAARIARFDRHVAIVIRVGIRIVVAVVIVRRADHHSRGKATAETPMMAPIAGPASLAGPISAAEICPWSAGSAERPAAGSTE